MSESEHSRETRSTRGTELCAQGTVGVRGEAFVLSPCHLSHLHCQPLRRQPTPLSHMDSPPFCSPLRHPVSKGWGVFSAFFPHLPTAPPLHGPPRHPPLPKVGVYSALSSPTFGKRQAPSPLSFRLQKFTLRPSSRPAVHHSAVFCTERSRECLPYSRGPFSVPDVPESGSRTGEGSFLYRTENRLKVIEL